MKDNQSSSGMVVLEKKKKKKNHSQHFIHINEREAQYVRTERSWLNLDIASFGGPVLLAACSGDSVPASDPTLFELPGGVFIRTSCPLWSSGRVEMRLDGKDEPLGADDRGC